MAAGGKNKGNQRRKKLSPEERKFKAQQRAFYRQVRTIFQKTGFARIPEASDKEFTFSGRPGDFDDVFVRENLIVCVEYTMSSGEKLGEHIKGKALLFNLIHKDPSGFIQYLCERFPAARATISDRYHDQQLRLRVAYCSPTEVRSEHADLTSETFFMWRGTIQYFKALAETIRISARHELFEFFDLSFDEVGEDGKLPDDKGEGQYPGSLLPEAHSNFPKGYKVVSFYVTPAALLKRAYVLRKDGWKDGDGLYQRMIERKKIESIRQHLRKNGRVFVNNVIVTLPDGTRLDDASGKDVDPAKIEKAQSVSVKLPQRANSVGIVDGQHRIFSYYEDIKDDPRISAFRDRVNLLATGIIYPAGLAEAERGRFEAGLFLEINSTQNSAKSDLKQAIAVIIDPYSADSIGKRVVTRLGQKGPLEGLLERHYFDKGVLKTSSMVSFAMARLVRLDGEESLINRWASGSREDVKARKSDQGLIEYVDFCASELTTFLGAVKASLPKGKWEIASKQGEGILTVTSLNSLFILFRKVVHRGGLGDFEIYRDKLTKIGNFDFSKYRSSQYNRAAEDMLSKVYGK
jgi:DGQHR domain-containing protein